MELEVREVLPSFATRVEDIQFVERAMSSVSSTSSAALRESIAAFGIARLLLDFRERVERLGGAPPVRDGIRAQSR